MGLEAGSPRSRSLLEGSALFQLSTHTHPRGTHPTDPNNSSTLALCHPTATGDAGDGSASFPTTKAGRNILQTCEGVLGAVSLRILYPLASVQKGGLSIAPLPHSIPCIICSISYSPLALCVFLPLLGTLQVILSYLKSIPAE